MPEGEEEPNFNFRLKIAGCTTLTTDEVTPRRKQLGSFTSRANLKSYLNPQIIQKCLQTLDIFKQLMNDVEQRKKVIRDVCRTINMHYFAQDSIVYKKGDSAEDIYLVLSGMVSLCMPTFKEEVNQDKEKIFTMSFQQIDTFDTGTGLGEGEFISQKRRGLTAIVKEQNTILGLLGIKSFEEIIESYRQRVYQKKLDRFRCCPLLKLLQPHQLEFIVNNAKPFLYPISKIMAREGQKPKFLYLIMEGQVQLLKKATQRQGEQQPKIRNLIDKQLKKQNMITGVVEEGAFIGDSELALGQPFEFTGICKSEKVIGYVCDQRIVMSQLTGETLEKALVFYRSKQSYYSHKEKAYQQVQQTVQLKFQEDNMAILNDNQLAMKRIIHRRYAQKVPTLIGRSSPKEIELMINRKLARIKTEHSPINLPSIVQLSPIKPSPKRKYSCFKSTKASQSKSPPRTRSISIDIKPQLQDRYQKLKDASQLCNQIEWVHDQVCPKLISIPRYHSKISNNKQVHMKGRRPGKKRSEGGVETERMNELVRKMKKTG